MGLLDAHQLNRERLHLERSHLERLKKNLYIDPGDPLYLLKKLRYSGQDFDTLFQMAELREREGKPEKALELYRRAEQAANGVTQFSRAVYRRRQLERLLQGTATMQLAPAQRPLPSLQLAAASHLAQSASAVAPARTTIGKGASSRALIGLMALLLGLLVGLLGAFWLVQYRLDVHFYHHAGPGDQPPSQLQSEPSALQPNILQQGALEEAEFGLTYLRSAILGYYRLEGKFPDSLDELAGPFPSNYISGIPPDPVYGKRQVVARWDGTGGWVYQKPQEEIVRIGIVQEGIVREGAGAEEATSSVDPFVAVTQALQPNWRVGAAASHPGETDEDALARSRRLATDTSTLSERLPRFEPLRLLIFPDERRVALVAGHLTLLAADVAVGLPHSPTPEGDFFVQRRVWLLQGDMPERQTARHADLSEAKKPLFTVSSPYGVAGLEFADGYAIHGTNAPATVGQAVTLGCVRLDNETMRQLFAWTPLGTEVMIRNRSEGESSSVVSSLLSPKLGSFEKLVGQTDSQDGERDAALRAIQPRADEQDPVGVYDWKG